MFYFVVPLIGTVEFSLRIRRGTYSLDAYANREAAASIDVCNRDDEVDAMHTSLFRELLTYMMEDPRNISFCAHLLFVAKNVERIGDHSTNIAETINYLVTGQNLTVERPKDDRTTAPASASARTLSR